METQTYPFEDQLLLLPAYVDKSKVEKRQIDTVKFNERVARLTPQQKEAFNQLMDFSTKKFGMYVLKGYAGTGKTFLITTVIEGMLLKDGFQNIAITAPTNKAVKVLKQSAEFESKSIEYSTVHKLLGLKEQITGYGQQLFVRDFKAVSKIDSLSVLFIDEVSMLNDDLFDMILPYVQREELKIVFIGDPAQIPPVGKKDCIPFNVRKQAEYAMQVVELTDIVRQAKGNPIIGLTFKIRERLDARDPIQEDRVTQMSDTGAGVAFLDVDNRDLFLKMLKTYFCSENFTKDADFAHIIAWRNDTVGKFNRIVRGLIYGKQRANEEALIVGEKLIANKPICEVLDDRTFIVFNNNEEFEVVEFTIKTDTFWQSQYTYYHALVMSFTAEGPRKERIKILHPDSYQQYTDTLDTLKETALAKEKGSWQAKDAWKNWYAFADVFADVGYNYAITAHKAQGSTYENTIVIEGDLDYNSNLRERNRIKYTAFSRPSHRLIIAE